MNKIPLMLIYSRVLIGVVVVMLSAAQPLYFRQIIIGLIVVGLLSDVFDGIIARHLKISTQKLRRLDSTVDQFFWLMVTAGTYIMCQDFFKTHLLMIGITVGLEVLCYAISYIRFKKEVATHALSSKLWALTLLATLIQVIATCNSVVLFNLFFYLGILTRLEIIGMLFIIKQWTNDIPTIYHAVLMRKGKPVKRHKLFNG